MHVTTGILQEGWDSVETGRKIQIASDCATSLSIKPGPRLSEKQCWNFTKTFDNRRNRELTGFTAKRFIAQTLHCNKLAQTDRDTSCYLKNQIKQLQVTLTG